MTRSVSDEEHAALGRFVVGLRLRILELLVALPALMLAQSHQHPLTAWFQGAVWVLGPLSGVLLISGANGVGSRAAGLALTMATAAEGYAAMMGFYGSPVALEQVPFASTAAEVLALIGLLSMVSTIRGIAEDAASPTLVRRCFRASANVVVTLACAIIVRATIWQIGLVGLPSLIIVGAVVAFAVVALMSVMNIAQGSQALLETLKEGPPPGPHAPPEGGHRPG